MKNSIIIIIALFSFSFMNAQSNEDFSFKGNETAFGAFGEEIAQEEMTVAAKTLKVAANFTGFKVELDNTMMALEGSNPMFADFNAIALQEGFRSFSYLVGSFDTKEAAQDFINNEIQDRYPNAQIVAFQNGIAATQSTKVVQCFELMD